MLSVRREANHRVTIPCWCSETAWCVWHTGVWVRAPSRSRRAIGSARSAGRCRWRCAATARRRNRSRRRCVSLTVAITVSLAVSHCVSSPSLSPSLSLCLSPSLTVCPRHLSHRRYHCVSRRLSLCVLAHLSHRRYPCVSRSWASAVRAVTAVAAPTGTCTTACWCCRCDSAATGFRCR
jgi:hypothetical protein